MVQKIPMPLPRDIQKIINVCICSHHLDFNWETVRESHTCLFFFKICISLCTVNICCISMNIHKQMILCVDHHYHWFAYYYNFEWSERFNLASSQLWLLVRCHFRIGEHTDDCNISIMHWERALCYTGASRLLCVICSWVSVLKLDGYESYDLLLMFAVLKDILLELKWWRDGFCLETWLITEQFVVQILPLFAFNPYKKFLFT